MNTINGYLQATCNLAAAVVNQDSTTDGCYYTQPGNPTTAIGACVVFNKFQSKSWYWQNSQADTVLRDPCLIANRVKLNTANGLPFYGGGIQGVNWQQPDWNIRLKSCLGVNTKVGSGDSCMFFRYVGTDSNGKQIPQSGCARGKTYYKYINKQWSNCYGKYTLKDSTPNSANNIDEDCPVGWRDTVCTPYTYTATAQGNLCNQQALLLGTPNPNTFDWGTLIGKPPQTNVLPNGFLSNPFGTYPGSVDGAKCWSYNNYCKLTYIASSTAQKGSNGQNNNEYDQQCKWVSNPNNPNGKFDPANIGPSGIWSSNFECNTNSVTAGTVGEPSSGDSSEWYDKLNPANWFR